MEQQNKTAQAAPCPPEQPRRRVGSLTMGVCFIVSGIFFLCCYFVPGFDWQLVLKIAPAAGLVLLGAEVLYFTSRPGRWKCDFWSVLACLLLMGVCFGLSLVPAVWDQLGPERRQAELRLGQQYTEAVYEQMHTADPDICVKDVRSLVHLYDGAVDRLEQLDAGSGWLEVNVELFGPYDSAADFAADCRRLTDAVRSSKALPDRVTFSFPAAQPDDETLSGGTVPCAQSYTLCLDGVAQLDWTADQMARQTQVESLLDQENAPAEQTFSAGDADADADSEEPQA